LRRKEEETLFVTSNNHLEDKQVNRQDRQKIVKSVNKRLGREIDRLKKQTKNKLNHKTNYYK
jgi:hypothetical protein